MKKETHPFWRSQASTLLATASVLMALIGFPAIAEEKGIQPDEGPRSAEDIEPITRLQVFLDRAQFAPGKIDGRMGQFTLQALALYREAHGGKPAALDPGGEANPEVLPDVSDLDLSSVEPVFLDYTVTEADLENIGQLPAEVAAQAKLDAMPYRSVAEAIAEKFHTVASFLEELNEGRTDDIKAGDTLRVPNVGPFDLAAVKDLEPGSALAGAEADQTGDDGGDREAQAEIDRAAKDPVEKEAVASGESVRIDVSSNMLTLYEDGKLVAAYPVTLGSGQTESPAGDWKVTAVAKMPDFRYDRAMLDRGVRSDDYHILPPGPNNPVGVMWIQLNKTGIGLHGTNEPETIGRANSHGCIRLANWDVVRLAEKISVGTPVVIQ